MSNTLDKKQATTFAPLQALRNAIKDMGCEQCEFLRGQACAGGEYPQQILILKGCPRR